MAAMTSRFNIRCVIQYYSDQWSTHIVHFVVKMTFVVKMLPAVSF